MPAPNIATLFDYESAYEDALRNHFLNVNVGVQFAQVLTPRTNLSVEAFVETPRLQIRCGLVGPSADGSGVKEDRVTINGNTTSYYSLFTMAVTLDVVTRRTASDQPHGLFRGAAREGMLSASNVLNANTVPYYQTWFVNPGASAQSIDLENDEIQTQLAYTLDFYVPPASWPSS